MTQYCYSPDAKERDQVTYWGDSLMQNQTFGWELVNKFNEYTFND